MSLTCKSEGGELSGTVKLSYEEFQCISYDGLGHHPLNGIHIVTPTLTIQHQKISALIFNRLMNFVEVKNLDIVLSSPIDVKFSNTDGYQPDIIFIDWIIFDV